MGLRGGNRVRYAPSVLQALKQEIFSVYAQYYAKTEAFSV